MHMEPFPSQKGCWNVFLLDSRCSGAAMFEHDLSLEGVLLSSPTALAAVQINEMCLADRDDPPIEANCGAGYFWAVRRCWKEKPGRLSGRLREMSSWTGTISP
ncbi:hypothetical protein TWF594_008732 [Orbilia oligospora]|nr:hypothetical protein TWF594_008732 [Orbilia oligospora]